MIRLQYMWISIVPFIFIQFLRTALANEVNGEPFVSCSADAIYVKMKTTETFEGHVNVKFAPNKYCYQVLVTNNQIEILIPHQDCALARKRIHSPDGVMISAELIVSFHPEFLTKDDRNYRFECFHTRTDGKALGKGDLTTEASRSVSEDPQCEYSILSSQGGRVLKTASIGDVVFHEWKCKNTHGDCLTVRNCHFVTTDTKYPLIDDKGCSLDPYVLPQLQYFTERLVGQNVSIFGVSQKPIVYFECELVLTEPFSNGTCDRPICDDKTTRKRRSPKESNIIEVQSQRMEISEVRREERDNEDSDTEEDQLAQSSNVDMALVECAPDLSNHFVCFTPAHFFVVATMVALVVFSSIFSISYFLCRRSKYTGVQLT